VKSVPPLEFLKMGDVTPTWTRKNKGFSQIFNGELAGSTLELLGFLFGSKLL